MNINNFDLDYGDIIISQQEKLRPSFKTGIVIPTFGRSNYVRQCLDSLRNTNLDDSIICIIDETEAAPNYPEIPGFTVFPNVDSVGNDIEKTPILSSGFQTALANNKSCIAFNSVGWMKYQVNPEPKWMIHSHFATYISNDYLEKNPYLNDLYKAAPFEPDKETPQLIKEFSLQGTPVIKIFKKEWGNMFDSLRTGMDILSQYTDTLVILDSDTIQSVAWLNTLHETYASIVEDHLNKHVVLSGFHIRDHKTLKTKKNYRLKKSLGGCNLYLTKTSYQELLRPLLNDVNWDHELTLAISEKNGILASTRPSVVQHIGSDGLWSCEGQYDQAKDFEASLFKTTTLDIIDFMKKSFIKIFKYLYRNL